MVVCFSFGMGSKSRKGRKKKRKVTGDNYEPENVKLAPHSFVICRGKISNSLTELMQCMRQVMMPYTASNLKDTRKNVLKDYVAIAGPMHVSHLIVFSQTSMSPVMKIAHLPHGPTVYFRINSFSTINDVLNHVERTSLGEKLFHYQPLVAVNNFDTKLPHHVITSSMLQNMFPKLVVSQMNLKRTRRCLLFHYDSLNDVIEFRQYRIRLLSPDLSRSVKKIISESNISEMNKFRVISIVICAIKDLIGFINTRFVSGHRRLCD